MLYHDMEVRFRDLLDMDIPAWVIDPFVVNAAEVDVSLQEALIELQSDIAAKNRCTMPINSRFKDFLLGILLGLSLTILFVAKNVMDDITFVPAQEEPTLTRNSPWFQPQGVVRMGVANGTQVKKIPPNDNQYLDSDLSSLEDDRIAKEMSKKVRVLIWVMTSPKTLPTKAQAIKETWGKRCNIIIYFSSTSDQTFPTVSLDVPEGRNHLTGKTMAAFRYIYENHFNDADWFMKADDDTYVIVENLRYFLSSKDNTVPIYFGHLFKVNVQQGYYSGGSGYVISKEALHRFGTKAINSTICRADGGDEDVEFGLCMEKLGVKTSISLDDMGRSLFHPQHPQIHLLGKFPPWHYRYSEGIPRKGFGVSRYPVSFHYVPPDDMRTLDYYFYHIRPYGIHSAVRTCNETKSPHLL